MRKSGKGEFIAMGKEVTTRQQGYNVEVIESDRSRGQKYWLRFKKRYIGNRYQC